MMGVDAAFGAFLILGLLLFMVLVSLSVYE